MMALRGTSNRLSLLLVFAVHCALCVSTSGVSAPAVPPVRTLAVLNFANRKRGDGWDWLEKGLADMLITDLSASGMFQVAARESMQFALDELELGAAGIVDAESAQHCGAILAAELVVTGSFLNRSGRLGIECHIVDLTSGELLRVEEVSGPGEEALRLEKDIALKLVQRFDLPLSARDREALVTMRTASVDAASMLYKAVDRWDNGDVYGALTGLRKALRADPQFDRARLELGRVYCTALEHRHADAEFLRLAREQPDSVFAPEALLAHARLTEKYLAASGDDRAACYAEVAATYPRGMPGAMGVFRAAMLTYMYGTAGAADELLGRAAAYDMWRWNWQAWMPVVARLTRERLRQGKPRVPEGVIFCEGLQNVKAWLADHPVPALPYAEGGAFYPCLIQDNTGRYWLVYNDQCSERLWARTGGDADIWLTSSDDGLNWTPPARLAVNSDRHDLHPWLILDRQHRLRLYWTSQRKGRRTFDILTAVSQNGRDWAIPRSCGLKRLCPIVVPKKGLAKRIVETSFVTGTLCPRVIRRRNGGFRMLYRSAHTSPESRAHGYGVPGIADSDDGFTWQDHRVVADGVVRGPFSLLEDRDGALVLTGQADSSLWLGVSRDDGQSWDADKPEGTPSLTWPDWPQAFFDPDGRLRVAFTQQNKGIHLASFDERYGWRHSERIGPNLSNPGAPFVLCDGRGELWLTWASGSPVRRARCVRITRLGRVTPLRR